MKPILHRYLPGHFHSPVKLAHRLLKTGDAAAIEAMAFAALGVIASPIDIALQHRERRLLKQASSSPPRPLVLVCGPPRSGTTVVFQTLVSSLPLAYFSNAAAIFPRSPLTATKFFGLAQRSAPQDQSSFYGKTRGLRGTCDVLAIWDNWFGPDRMRPILPIPAAQAAQMQRFFTAADQLFERPLCCKNNSLNLLASAVAECLPHSVFVCLQRDSVKLASSLYRARLEIHGDSARPYGLTAASADSQFTDPSDPAESVIQQVRFYESLAAIQLERVGAERFWITSYEEFCRRPELLVNRVADVAGVAGVAEAHSATTTLRPPQRSEIPVAVRDRFEEAFQS